MEVQPSYRTSLPGFRLHQKASSLFHHWADRIPQETIDELELFEPFHEFDKSIQTHRSPAATDLDHSSRLLKPLIVPWRRCRTHSPWCSWVQPRSLRSCKGGLPHPTFARFCPVFKQAGLSGLPFHPQLCPDQQSSAITRAKASHHSHAAEHQGSLDLFSCHQSARPGLLR